MRRRLIILATGCVAVVGSVMAIGLGGAGASTGTNTQDHVSATGLGGQPVGLWLWSTTTSGTYGNGGNGSIYFYALIKGALHADVAPGTVVISGSTISENVTAEGVDCPGSTGAASGLVATETSPGHGTATLSCTVNGHNVTASGPAEVNISHS